MDIKFKVTIILVLIVAIGFAISWYVNMPSNKITGAIISETDKLAMCLTQKGIAMGGTEWCPHCKEQKKLFGDSFRYITYHDCDIDKQWCEGNGIRGYPTWVFPENKKYEGVQQLKELVRLSGC